MINMTEAVITIDGATESEAKDIRRCLASLYFVREGEQPLDRNFGLKQDFLDQPVNIAKNMLALEIIEKTRRYETRVLVEKVDYITGEEGQLIPVVRLKRGGKR